MKLTVTGDAELRRQIARIRDGMAGDILENAVVSGALLVANRAKELAAFRSGTLRRSIHVGGHTDRTPDYAEGPDEKSGVEEFNDIGGATRGRQSASVMVGTDVPYAPRIEFGFADVDRLGRRYSQPAQPFLRPAYDETRDDVVKEIGEALEDQLRKLTKGAP